MSPSKETADKLSWVQGYDAINRVKAGEPVEAVAEAVRRSPEFITGMVDHFEGDLPNFLSPYMDRRMRTCSRSKLVAKASRRGGWQRFIATVRGHFVRGYPPMKR
jgi:hypothetical protein